MEFGACTDIGKNRAMNQDFFFAGKEPVGSFPNLFIVADGMGGHKAGDRASRLCVENMVSFIRNTDLKTPVSVFEEAIGYANHAVYEDALSNEEYSGMGTTLVAACVIDGNLYVANIGDSRLYLINDEIRQITDDHSLVREMVKHGDITENEARSHPKKNIITRAVGIDPQVTADYFSLKLKPGDSFLMCTDGLSNMVEDYDLRYIVQKNTNPEEAAKELVKKANENGGLDNITAVVVKY